MLKINLVPVNEKVRHRKTALPRTKRKRPLCKNCIENECNFITCPLYNLERVYLLKSNQRNSAIYSDIPTDNLKFILVIQQRSSSK